MKIFLYLLLLGFLASGLTFCTHSPDTISDLDPVDTTTPPPPPPPVVKCSPDSVYFENEILPIMISNCAKSGCHDPQTAEDDVILNNYQNIIQTGEIVPGYPGSSKLYEKIVQTEDEDRMPPPPSPPLTTQQIQAIATWISQGAKNNRCDSVSCDTNNVTWSGSLRGIVDITCKGCHNPSLPGGGFDLSTYEGLKNAAASGKLMPAISHQSAFPMPKGGAKLADCQIRMFGIWIDNNYPQ